MNLFLKASGVLGVRGLGMIAQLVLLVVAAHTVSLAAVGYFSAIITVMTFARQLGPLGSDTLLMSHARDGAEPGIADISARLALTLIPRVLLGALIGGIASVIFLRVTAGSGDAHLTWATSSLVVFLVVGVSLTGVCVGVMRARYSAMIAQLPESLIQPGAALAIYACSPVVGVHRTLTTLIVSQALGVACALAIYLAIIAIRGVGPSISTVTKRAFHRSCYVILRGAIWNTVGARAGTLFVLAIGGAKMAGLYGTALQVQLIGTNVTWALGLAAAPTFAATFRRRELRALQSQLTRSTLMAVIPSGLVVVALVAIGPRAMEVFGSTYRPAYWTAVVLALVAMSIGSTALTGYLYNVTGQESVCTRANFYQLVAVLVATPPLTWLHGSLGAAIGVLIGVIVRNYLLNRWLHPTLGIRPGLIGPFVTHASRDAPRHRANDSNATTRYLNS